MALLAAAVPMALNSVIWQRNFNMKDRLAHVTRHMHGLRTGNLRNGHSGGSAAAVVAIPPASIDYATADAIKDMIRRAKALGHAANLCGEQPPVVGTLHQHGIPDRLHDSHELPGRIATLRKAAGAFSSSSQEYA
jgi:hypothetical protein